MTLPTAVVCDPVFKRHDTGPRHCESPQRIDAIADAIARAGFADRLLMLAPRPAEDDDLLACHLPGYLEWVNERFDDIYTAAVEHVPPGDVSMSRVIARLAAGSVLAAVDAVMDGRAANAFCAVRPPGHHASAGRAMGFCIFNNVAVAARYAQRAWGLERVLIADWDVHHGNGTQDIFYADPSVFYFSVHQSPHYPGTGGRNETGTGPGAGATMNFPMPGGAGGAEILPAFTDALAAAMDRFRPELVLISAGFDSRVDDPLGGLALTDDDFAAMTRACMAIADRHADGRVVSTLEGGYALAGLAAGVTAHVGALCERPPVGTS